MRQRFVTSQWVPFTVDAIFGFFINPRNLPLLMPERLQTRIERLTLKPAPPDPFSAANSDAIPGSDGHGRNEAAGIGSEIELSFRPIPYLPLRVRWTARITEFSWFSYICDEQVRGPFRHFHHCHGIRAEMQQGRPGTRLSDEIEFELPMGKVGQHAR